MIISFVLNGKPVEADLPPQRRAVNVLREEFNCRSLHTRCNSAHCGCCLILCDNKAVLSCNLPAFELRSRTIWTAEGLSKQEGYQDILRGFRDNNLQLCHLCAPARMVSAEALLRSNLFPRTPQLLEIVKSVSCNCSSTARMLNSLLKAAKYRYENTHDS